MSTLQAAEYSWSSHYGGFAMDRGSQWFGRGYDPYDSAAAYAAWQAELIELLEGAWKACIKSTTPAPSLITLSERAYFDVMHTWRTCDLPWYRGHEFLPYD